MNMYYALFIIGAALPSMILAKDVNAKESKTEAVRCNDTEVIGAGDKIFQCFGDMVEHKLNETHKDCKDIKSTLATYTEVANKSACYKSDGQNVRNDFGVTLHNLMEYSLKHSAFNDFVANGGLVCIDNVKENITKCLANNVGVIEGDDKYYKLWRKTTPVLKKSTCKHAEDLKKCVLGAIKGSRTCITKTHVLEVATYVNSLFETMLVKCSIFVRDVTTSSTNHLPPSQTRTQPPFEPPTKASGSVTALLGVILALVLISMLYVVVRDCRSSGNTWKPEAIPMTSRNGN